MEPGNEAICNEPIVSFPYSTPELFLCIRRNIKMEMSYTLPHWAVESDIEAHYSSILSKISLPVESGVTSLEPESEDQSEFYTNC